MLKKLVLSLLFLVPSIALAGGSGTINQLEQWLVSGGYLKTASSTVGIWIPSLAAGGNPCIVVGATGKLSTSACGSGSQTPWTSVIDGAGFALTNGGAITGTVLTATSTVTASSFQQLLVNASTSLRNFTALSATTTNATSSAFAISSLISQLLSTNANGSVIGTTVSSPLTFSGNALGCQAASGSQAGCLSLADWGNFNNKVSSTSISATSPIFWNSGTGVISSQAATAAQNGYLTLGDWTTFNNKLGTSTVLTPGQVVYVSGNPALVTSVATGTISGTNGVTVTANRYAIGGPVAVDCTVATASAAGCLATADWSKFNNKVSSTSLSGVSVISYNSGTGVITTTGGTFGAGNYTFPTDIIVTGNSTDTNATSSNTFFAPIGGFSRLTVGTTTASTTIYGSNSTSTFAGGVKAPCFSSDGGATCLSSTASLSGGTAAMLTAWLTSSTVTATGTPTMTALIATTTTATSTFAGTVAVGTSSPFNLPRGSFLFGTSSPIFFLNGATGNIGFGTTSVPSTAQPAKLMLDLGTSASEEAFMVMGNNNDFLENNVQNISAGALAQGCQTATANNGTLTTGFIALCANSSTFWNPQTYNVGGPSDTSLMFSNNDGYIAQAVSGKKLHILNGGTSTSTNEVMTFSGNNVGIGTSSPYATLSVNGQVAAAYFTATTSSFATQSSLPWVTMINSTTTAATTTNLYVSRNISIGTSTAPIQGLTIASGTLVVSEYIDATSTYNVIKWASSTQHLLKVGGAAFTVTFASTTVDAIPGQTLRVVICNPSGGTAGAITWVDNTLNRIRWSGGTQPTQTTTSNKCDAWSFVATAATSSVIYIGALSNNY